MNVIFTCGGTGGHINPAIAIANVLKERHPDANILFVGASGEMEENLVPRAGFPIKTVRCAGFSREFNKNGIMWNIKAVGTVRRAVKSCEQIVAEFKPDVIVGTGGFASYPTMKAGNKLGVPVLVHEANAVPGLTTKMAARKACKVLVSYEESAQYYREAHKVEVVGMPVRREFITTNKAEARAKLGLDDRPLVVSAFGSQGSRPMNYLMAEVMTLGKEAGYPFRHIHASGTNGIRWMPEYLEKAGVAINDGNYIEVKPYIYDMPTVMAAADVVIGRAGASTCNEIAASGTPCILIPSPNVTNNHQEKNARVLEKRGGAIVLLESECTGEDLFRVLRELMEDEQRRKQMSVTLRNTAVLDCAERICNMIEELAARKG